MTISDFFSFASGRLSIYPPHKWAGLEHVRDEASGSMLCTPASAVFCGLRCPDAVKTSNIDFQNPHVDASAKVIALKCDPFNSVALIP
jgi:hypothetical protein